jgi:hypothetical protein
VALTTIGRSDLWDAGKKVIKANWQAMLHSERVKVRRCRSKTHLKGRLISALETKMRRPLLNFAFKFNLRRHIKEDQEDIVLAAKAVGSVIRYHIKVNRSPINLDLI